ncbi:MAG: tetraacyldisaccharide 4'-kinase [Parvularculaceae bacterium]
MREPWFWRRHDAAARLAAMSLSPLSFLYDFTQQRRMKRIAPQKAGAPLLCIGNSTLGGAGKTPLAIAVHRLFKSRGVDAFFASRGYKGSLAGPIRVGAEHSAADVGDEPLLLSKEGAVFIGKDRLSCAREAAKAGAPLIIMDDGFQNPVVAKDFSILIANDGDYENNGRIFPAGPNRESFSRAAARADLIVAIDDDDAPEEYDDKPVIRARSQVTAPFERQAVYAFCGIARPKRFFKSLEKLGFTIAGWETFPDHYPFDEAEHARLVMAAARAGAKLITTEKDLVRFPDFARTSVAALKFDLVLEETEAFLSLAAAKLGIAI